MNLRIPIFMILCLFFKCNVLNVCVGGISLLGISVDFLL